MVVKLVCRLSVYLHTMVASRVWTYALWFSGNSGRWIRLIWTVVSRYFQMEIRGAYYNDWLTCIPTVGFWTQNSLVSTGSGSTFPSILFRQIPRTGTVLHYFNVPYLPTVPIHRITTWVTHACSYIVDRHVPTSQYCVAYPDPIGSGPVFARAGFRYFTPDPDPFQAL